MSDRCKGCDVPFMDDEQLRCIACGRARDNVTADPTREEMRAFLDGVASHYEADDFDIEEAMYAFAASHHGGQGSNLYAALSLSPFRPGPLWREPQGFAAMELYCELAAHFS